MAKLVSNIDQWDRVGGRVIQFFATDEEVDDVLKQYLPVKYGPYFLVGSEWVKLNNGKHAWKPFSYPFSIC